VARERRMIARASFRSKKLSKVTDSAHLLFYGLILEADDEGRGEGDPETLTMCYPNRKWSLKKIENMMFDLSEAGLIDWYTIDGGQYYAIRQWMRYQEGSWHGRSAKPSIIPEGKHQDRCTRTPSVVTPNTNQAPKLSKEKLSKEKLREEKIREEAPAHIQKLIHLAKEIRGWNFTEEQDTDFFARLLLSYPQEVIEKTIEDLRVYQEKPAKKYTNLHSTLRNWCKRALPEDEPRKPDIPLDEYGNPKVRRTDGVWITAKEAEETCKRTEKGWELK